MSDMICQRPLLLGSALAAAAACRGHGFVAPPGFSPSRHAPKRRRRCRSALSMSLQSGGEYELPPPDADGTPRSPLMDAFRVQRLGDWQGAIGTGAQVRRRRGRRRRQDGRRNPLASAYAAAGLGTIAAWSACAVSALTTHPDAALDAICGFRHNALTISQAVAFPVPLTLGVVSALRRSSSARGERSSLSSTTHRRLALGLASCSLWLGASAAHMPAFACGYQMHAPVLRAVASAAHLATAGLCLASWSSAVGGGGDGMEQSRVSRLVRGVIGSVACLPPKGASDDPDTARGSDGRNEYALCSVLFAWFAVLPVVSPFPLATVPAILGRRLSRAASGWTFLAAVVSYVLKDGVERGGFVDNNDGTGDDTATFRPLRRGLAIGSVAHLLVIALKLIGVDGGGLLLPGRGLWEVYPMALAVPFTAASSCLMYAIAAFASWSSSNSSAARSDEPLGAFE